LTTSLLFSLCLITGNDEVFKPVRVDSIVLADCVVMMGKRGWKWRLVSCSCSIFYFLLLLLLLLLKNTHTKRREDLFFFFIYFSLREKKKKKKKKGKKK
jgi:hypothetical protein